MIGSSAGLSSEQLEKIKRLERNKVRINLFIRACRVVYANKVRFFLQVRIKENLYSYFFYLLIMDTLAFWLPLLLLFLSALIGAVIKRRSCDHCLKKFENSKVSMQLGQNWVCGTLEVFAQGIELRNLNHIEWGETSVHSHIIHAVELEKVSMIIRKAPPLDTNLGQVWQKERKRLVDPPLQDRIRRSVLNSFNMLRDSFGQAMKAIIGSMSKDTRLGKTRDADKRFGEIQGNLTNMIPNSWEPILEEYLGNSVAVERKTGSGLLLDSGILEDYSSKYLLLRDVKVTGSVFDQEDSLGISGGHAYDILYSRDNTILRYSLKE